MRREHTGAEKHGKYLHCCQDWERNIVVFLRHEGTTKHNAQSQTECLKCQRDSYVQVVMTSLPQEEVVVQGQHQIKTANYNALKNIRATKSQQVIRTVHQDADQDEMKEQDTATKDGDELAHQFLETWLDGPIREEGI